MRIPGWKAATWLPSLTVAALVCHLSACAHTVVAHGTKAVPGARAEVKLELDENNNTEIDIKMEHLAPPERMRPPAKAYVAWVRDENGRVTNIGRLQIEKDRTGRLVTSTPLHRFTLLITAESDPSVDSPQGPVAVETEPIDIGE